MANRPWNRNLRQDDVPIGNHSWKTFFVVLVVVVAGYRRKVGSSVGLPNEAGPREELFPFFFSFAKQKCDRFFSGLRHAHH
jgi:hypothetical protein